jgi:virginiamycin B lyase
VVCEDRKRVARPRQRRLNHWSGRIDAPILTLAVMGRRWGIGALIAALVGVAALPAAAGAAPATVQAFDIPAPWSVNGLATGPDGNLWFAAAGPTPEDPACQDGLCRSQRDFGIGRLTPAGGFTLFPLPRNTCGSPPVDVTAGPDGALWYAQGAEGSVTGLCKVVSIGRMTTAGAVTLAVEPETSPSSIVAGTDGHLYFTGFLSGFFDRVGEVGRVATDGTVTSLAQGVGVAFRDVVVGRDGAVWAGLTTFPGSPFDGRELLRVGADGAVTLHDAELAADRLDRGPDGTVWYLAGSRFAEARMGVREPRAVRFGAGGRAFSLGDPDFTPLDLATGADGQVWVVGETGGEPRLRRLSPDGALEDYGDLLSGHVAAAYEIERGPGGALWIAGYDDDKPGLLLRLTPGDPPGGARAGTRLVLQRLRLTPRTFVASRTRGSIDHRDPMGSLRGANVNYRLSDAAKVTFTVQRRRNGRWAPVKGRFTHGGLRGANNAFEFSGTVGGRKLAPGRYRLTGIATSPQRRRSKPARATFSVIKAARRPGRTVPRRGGR